MSPIGRSRPKRRILLHKTEEFAIRFDELHVRATFGLAEHACRPFARDLITIGRVDIRERHAALETCGDRTDPQGDPRLQIVIIDSLDVIAARDTGLEYIDIVSAFHT